MTTSVVRAAKDGNIFDFSLARNLREKPFHVHQQLIERFTDDLGIGRIRFTDAGRKFYEPLYREAGFVFVSEPDYNDFVIDVFLMGRSASAHQE